MTAISSMPAVSVRQPWAWAISDAKAGKDIENRGSCDPWRSRVGQRVLIHAAKGCTREEWEDGECFISNVAHRAGRRIHVPALDALSRGGFVATATLAAVVHLESGDGWGRFDRDAVQANPWAVGPFCLVLEDVRPCSFLPWKGAPGWFPGPPDVEAAARAWAATMSPLDAFNIETRSR
jgi:hypothetical protein